MVPSTGGAQGRRGGGQCRTHQTPWAGRGRCGRRGRRRTVRDTEGHGPKSEVGDDVPRFPKETVRSGWFAPKRYGMGTRRGAPRTRGVRVDDDEKQGCEGYGGHGLGATPSMSTGGVQPPAQPPPCGYGRSVGQNLVCSGNSQGGPMRPYGTLQGRYGTAYTLPGGGGRNGRRRRRKYGPRERRIRVPPWPLPPRP